MRVCVCVCVWVLWACNVRLTPKAKQLNVEIQEIQVNIKRKNYVNQKVKATRQWREGTTARRGQHWQLGARANIKAVAKKIFSAKAKSREKKYCQVF